MNLNEYIKQTESEFDDKFTMGYEGEYLQNFKSGTKPETIKAFIKTSIERGVELARQEAIDVVEGLKLKYPAGQSSHLFQNTSGHNTALSQVIKKLEDAR